MQYQVTIQDSDGTTCRIALTLPYVAKLSDPGNSQWHVLDQGLIKFQGGGCDGYEGGGFKPVDIALCVATDGGNYGIKIYAMFDGAGFVNSSGSGVLAQPWAVGMKPGAMNWRLSTGDAPAATSKTASTDGGDDNNAMASADSSSGGDNADG